MHTSLRFVTLASANGIHRKQKGRILRKKEVISPSICVEENWFNQVIIISLETFNIFSSSFLMWTKIPQMCFRIHFREGRTAKLHSWKKFQRSQLPSFSVSFPPSIQSCYIHPPRILASFSSGRSVVLSETAPRRLAPLEFLQMAIKWYLIFWEIQWRGVV